MGAFERYAPFVQDYIYRNNWENLRAIQVAAADAIFNTDENLLLTVNAGSSEFGSFLAFETLTLCHFDTSAIDVSMLDKDEIEWINAYNRRVFLTLGPLLDKEIAQWLEAKTAPLVLE